MRLEFLLIPQIALVIWFLFNRFAAKRVSQQHSGEYAMLQLLRDYLRDGLEASSKAELMHLTKACVEDALHPERHLFYLPHRDGTWTIGESTQQCESVALLAQIAECGHVIVRAEKNPFVSIALSQAANAFMDQQGLNALLPVTDSMTPQWIWAGTFSSPPGLDALRSWQMAMRSVAERAALRMASAHLLELQKDAESATQVLRVLLPESPYQAQSGMEWAGRLARQRNEAPILFATYSHEKDKLLTVFAEVSAPGFGAVILASALRGYVDSVVAASRQKTLHPEEILTKLNQFVCRPGQESTFSCIITRFDSKSRRIEYASAGTPHWLRLQADGAIASVLSTDPALGEGEQTDYQPRWLELAPGDTHFFAASTLPQKTMGSTVQSIMKSPTGPIAFPQLGTQAELLTRQWKQLAGPTSGSHALVILRPQAEQPQ